MLDHFLLLFGSVSVSQVVVMVSAILFLFGCYRSIKKYFTTKTLQEKENDDHIQQVIKQAEQYPIWHQQSIEIRDQLNNSIRELSEKIGSMSLAINNMKSENEQDRATNWRYRILRFNDEVIHGDKHTKEHFDQILNDVKKYKNYCRLHKDFENGKAEKAIENINRVYDKCVNDKTFL